MKTLKTEKKKDGIDWDGIEYIEPETTKPSEYDLWLTKPSLDKGLATRSPRGKIQTLTPSASVRSYQNKAGDCDIVLTGGTVSLIQFSRNNVAADKITVPTTPLRLSQGDRIHVTYSVAPTAYLIPR